MLLLSPLLLSMFEHLVDIGRTGRGIFTGVMYLSAAGVAPAAKENMLSAWPSCWCCRRAVVCCAVTLLDGLLLLPLLAPHNALPLVLPLLFASLNSRTSTVCGQVCSSASDKTAAAAPAMCPVGLPAPIERRPFAGALCTRSGC